MSDASKKSPKSEKSEKSSEKSSSRYKYLSFLYCKYIIIILIGFISDFKISIITNSILLVVIGYFLSIIYVPKSKYFYLFLF